jgi:hypothetical protein
VIPTQISVPGLSGNSVPQEYLDAIDKLAQDLLQVLDAKSARAALIRA